MTEREELERKLELLCTPSPVIEALLDVEQFDGTILEPAAGYYDLVNPMRLRGYEVVAKDKYDWFEERLTGYDFLEESDQYDNVITNPPFHKTAKFIRQAKQAARRKIALLLQPQGGLFDETFPLKAIYEFPRRINFLQSDGIPLAKGGPSFPVCWYVWDREHRGGVEIRKLRIPSDELVFTEL